MPPAMSGFDRYWPMPLRDTRRDAGEDDEADAVAYAALSDELADPHRQDRARCERDHLGDRGQAQDVEVRDGAGLRGQDGQVAIRLEERKRHRQVARVLVDPGAAVFAFARQSLEAGHDARHELHDDRGVDVRVDTHRHDRERAQAAATEEVEQLQELLLIDDLGDRVAVDRRHRHHGQRPVDDEHSEHEQNAPADVRRTECVDQRLEHALEPSTQAAWGVSQCGRCAHSGVLVALGGATPGLDRCFFLNGRGSFCDRFRLAAAALADFLALGAGATSTRGAGASVATTEACATEPGAAVSSSGISAMICTKPPAASIFWRALALNACAATKSF